MNLNLDYFTCENLIENSNNSKIESSSEEDYVRTSMVYSDWNKKEALRD